MIVSAMKSQLTIKPLVGFLMHSDFWEGPCRAGKREDLSPEAERRQAAVKFEEYQRELQQDMIPQVNLLEPLMVPYLENLIVEENMYHKIESQLGEIDAFLVMNYRIPKLERYRKPIFTLSPGNEGADISAYCRSIGVEAYPAIDMDEMKALLYNAWVRKAVSKTRALVLTAGTVPTYGIQSNIRDLEKLRANYGFEILKKPFTDIFPYMDRVPDSDASQLAEKLLQESDENRVNSEYFPNDLKYYLAAKMMMEEYSCNSFSTSCIELCASRIPQDRKFAPCLAHSLLKAEGIPSGCEEDLNALLAMTVMMYAAGKPAFMGNPFYDTDEILTLHHSVPVLTMNGLGTEELPYRIYSFTEQGFGGKLQIDLAALDDPVVTLGRFNPAGDTLSLKVGKVVKSEYRGTYCSPYYFIEMDDVRGFIHHLADFGHHQVLVMGDQRKPLREIARLMNFVIAEA